jgi:hypothetical protein
VHSDAFAAAIDLVKDPFPPDVAARLAALERQITDESELDMIGDLWEALIAAGVDLN